MASAVQGIDSYSISDGFNLLFFNVWKLHRNLKKKITYREVLKTLRIRDKSDKQRKHGPLKKTKDSILINTTKLSKKACFKKIKAIMDKKLNN